LASGALVLTIQARGTQIIAEKVAQDALTHALGDFIRIAPDGEVLFQFIKHEMGQGVSTAMAQILCEELKADWERVKIQFPLVDLPTYENDRNGGYGTGGSCTLIYTFDVLRTAGAAARQMLQAAAAAHWSVPVEECRAENHWIVHAPSGRRASYGELAPLAARLEVPSEVESQDPKSFTIIGTPRAAKLIPQIVTGQLIYGMDVRLPGMLYAVIARCPIFKGKLKRYDARRALKVKGVRHVFTTKPIAGLQFTSFLPHDIREGVVVVADSTWAAIKGREALEIEWDEGPNGRLSTADFERLAAERALHRTDPTGFIGDANAVA